MIVCNIRNQRGPITGVQRYTAELYKRRPFDMESVEPDAPLSGVSAHLWEQIILPMRLKGRLLWSPSNTGPITVEKQAVTIHDLSPMDHPEWMSRKFAQWYQFITPKLVQNVRLILTDSHFSKDRLLFHFPNIEEKIQVTHLAADERFKPINGPLLEEDLKTLKIPTNNYLVAVGSIEPRKNLKTLFNVWRHYERKIDPDVSLVIIGDWGRKDVFGAFDIGEIPNRVYFTGRLDDRLLPSIYSGALASIYLSSYEGFGLPVLESMACGCPVICSNCSSISEVSADAGINVSPFDVEEIGEAILSIISDSDLRQKISQRGLLRASQFNWDKTAKEVYSAISKVDF